MEPMHIYALLHLKNAEEDRRTRLERRFVTRDEVRTARRERIHRLRRWVIGRGAPRPTTVELAVR
jgi:transposase